MTDSADVVVVGGGPAGSVAALLLARSGHHVILLDARHFPRDKPCGEFMSPGVADTLSRLQIDTCLEGTPPRPVAGMHIVGPSGASMDVEYQQEGARRMAMTLRRRILDTQLLRLASGEGVDVREGVRVRAPIVRDGTVVGVEALYRGEESHVRSGLTIAADGAHSVLSSALGLARRPLWPVRLGLVAHYEENADVPFTHGHMHVAKGGYCGIAPLLDSRLNVAMVLRADAVRCSSLPASQIFERWIASHPALQASLRPHSRMTPVIGIGPIGSRAHRSWFPGMLLVGDAAGFFDPFTGEGIFRALNGAELAASVAHSALVKGDVGVAALGGYDALRSARFRHKQAVTALVQLFVQYPLLMQYALPRLSCRQIPYQALSGALGDISDPRDFLRPGVLWSALRP